MTIASIDLLIIGSYLVFVLVLGLLARTRLTKTMEGYFLAGRSLPWWMQGLSGAAANIDVTGTMVVISWLFLLGVNGYWTLMSGHTAIMMAVVMVVIGKWVRRSRAVTSNEYIELRFGSGTSGRLSRLLGTIGQLLATLAALMYFATGTGKFFAAFLPFERWLPSEAVIQAQNFASLQAGGAAMPMPFLTEELACSVLVMMVGLIYTVASGYVGIVITDVAQTTVIVVAFVWLTVLAFTTVQPSDLDFIRATQPHWFDLVPPWRWDTSVYGNAYKGFELMLLICSFFILKSVLQGFGVLQGYAAQRWLACGSDRDAGLMSLVWLHVLTLRWSMVMGIALLAWALIARSPDSEVAGILRSDPERILPYILQTYLRPGVFGLVLAGMLAASISTFVSLVNSGASFVVRDLYQQYVAPRASQRRLMLVSYVASVTLVLVAALLARTVKNINDIWTWMMVGWTGAKFIPMTLFWYWHRANGTGFTVGSALGLTAAVVQRALWPDLNPIGQFFFSAVPSATGFIVGSLVTPAVDVEVSKKFYKAIRPFGFWGPIRAHFTPESIVAIRAESRRDLIAVTFAVPWLILLFLLPLLVMRREWVAVGALGAVEVALYVGLYRWWYRYLDKPAAEPVERAA